MIIKVDENVSVSVPTGIEKWAKESEDNMTELNVMLNSLVTTISKSLLEKFKETNPTTSPVISPYQRLYETQLKEAQDLGMTKESFDGMINAVMAKVEERHKSSELSSQDISDFLSLFQ